MRLLAAANYIHRPLYSKSSKRNPKALSLVSISLHAPAPPFTECVHFPSYSSLISFRKRPRRKNATHTLRTRISFASHAQLMHCSATQRDTQVQRFFGCRCEQTEKNASSSLRSRNSDALSTGALFLHFPGDGRGRNPSTPCIKASLPREKERHWWWWRCEVTNCSLGPYLKGLSAAARASHTNEHQNKSDARQTAFLWLALCALFPIKLETVGVCEPKSRLRWAAACCLVCVCWCHAIKN